MSIYYKFVLPIFYFLKPIIYMYKLSLGLITTITCTNLLKYKNSPQLNNGQIEDTVKHKMTFHI